MNIISIILTGLAALLVYFSGQKSITLLRKLPALIMASCLHLVASLLVLGLVNCGEAWSGYSSHHNDPETFLVGGGMLLVMIFLFTHKKQPAQVESIEHKDNQAADK